MTTTRKQYTPQFKARVAVEAIRGEKTLSQLGSQFKVHPMQIAKWRKAALEQLPEIFVDGRTRKARDGEADNDALYEEIGRLKVELDWLKQKKLECSREDLRPLVDRERVNQVWSTDITYIRMAQGFVYVVAVMDWFSRFVLSWSLSLTMEIDFCIEALRSALRRGRPEIFNSDQGSQFTSERFTTELEAREIAISMDGRGRCMDNIFIERLWRSLKYEEVYLKDYRSVTEARAGIEKYLRFYNQERLHQSLDYRTPAGLYLARG